MPRGWVSGISKKKVGQAVTVYLDEHPEVFGDILELDYLKDVTLSSPSDKEVLAYDSATSKWINQDFLASPEFTGVPTGPTAAVGAATTQLATTEFVYNVIADLDLYTLMGEITNANTNPNYPAADAGHIYVITGNAGKVGGAAGKNVEIGDTLLCINDDTPSGDEATVGDSWIAGQASLQPDLYALLSGATFTGDVTVPALILPDGGTIGQAAGPLLTFDDTANKLELTNAILSINSGIAAAADKDLLTLVGGQGLDAQNAIKWNDGTNTTGQIDVRFDGTYTNLVFGHLYNAGYQTSDILTIGGDEVVTLLSGGNQYGYLHSDGTREVGTYVSNTYGGLIGTKSNHALGFFTNDGVPSLYLDTSGNLGLGIYSLTEKFQLYKASGNIRILSEAASGASEMWLKGSTSAGLSLFDTTHTADLKEGNIVVDGGIMKIRHVNDARTLGTDHIVIDFSSGNVGIGAYSLTHKLEVDGGSSTVFTRISTTNTGTDAAGIILANSSKTAFNDGIQIAHGAGKTIFRDLVGNLSLVLSPQTGTTGRVGVGKSNPANPLEVGTALTVSSPDDTEYITIETTNGANRMWFSNSETFQLGVANAKTGAGFSSILNLTTGGNVGIGGTPLFRADIQKDFTEAYSASSRPTAILEVRNNTAGDSNHATIELQANPTTGNAGLWYMSSISAGSNLADLAFGRRTGSATFAEAVRFTSGGNVGINCTPSYKLDVRENTTGLFGAVFINSHVTGNGVLIRGGSTNSEEALQVQNNDGTATHLLVTGAGNVGINNNSPTGAQLVVDAAAAQRALTLNGAANSWTGVVTADGTTGQSFGLLVQGGTNGTDKSFEAQNAGGDSMLTVFGSGYTVIDINETVSDAEVLKITNSGTAGKNVWIGLYRSNTEFGRLVTSGANPDGIVLKAGSGKAAALLDSSGVGLIIANGGRVWAGNNPGVTPDSDVHLRNSTGGTFYRAETGDTSNAGITLKNSAGQNDIYTTSGGGLIIEGSDGYTFQSSGSTELRIKTTADGFSPYLRWEGFNRNLYMGLYDTGSDGELRLSNAAALTNPHWLVTPLGNIAQGSDTPNRASFGSNVKVLSIEGGATDAFGALELIAPNVTGSNRLGEIRFINLDGGSSPAAMAGIRATRDGDDTAAGLSFWVEPVGASITEALTIASNASIGIGVAPLTNMASGQMVLEGGALVLKVGTTPTNDPGYIKIYGKADTNLYYQDGVGVEHQINASDGTAQYASGTAAIAVGNSVTAIDVARMGLPTNIETFTSSGSFTPAVTKTYLIVCVGGGGGGAQGQNVDGSGDYGGGGGGGGELRWVYAELTAGTTYTITVGSGGAGGNGTNAPGNAGGNSSFGSVCIANGGAGGISAGTGGSGGSGGTGDGGGNGGAGATGSTNGTSGGGGGAGGYSGAGGAGGSGYGGAGSNGAGGGGGGGAGSDATFPTSARGYVGGGVGVLYRWDSTDNGAGGSAGNPGNPGNKGNGQFFGGGGAGGRGRNDGVGQSANSGNAGAQGIVVVFEEDLAVAERALVDGA